MSVTSGDVPFRCDSPNSFVKMRAYVGRWKNPIAVGQVFKT